MSSSPEPNLKALEVQLRQGSPSSEHRPHLGRLGALLAYCPPSQYTAPPPPESTVRLLHLLVCSVCCTCCWDQPVLAGWRLMYTVPHFRTMCTFHATHWKKLFCVSFSLPRTGTRYTFTQALHQSHSCAIALASYTSDSTLSRNKPALFKDQLYHACLCKWQQCICHAYFALQEFATERELCWHLCITLGLAKQHARLAQALSQAGIDEKNQPSEYRAKAQVASPCLPQPHATAHA